MSNVITKLCKTHGETLFSVYSPGRTRCRKCLTDAVRRRRWKIKKMAVVYKGGACSQCGFNVDIPSVYDFHHPDDNKEFGIASKGHTKSWEKVKLELDKCEILCANCHRIRHAQENP